MSENLLNLLSKLYTPEINYLVNKVNSNEIINASDINCIEQVAKKSEINEIDSFLYQIMYEIAVYNVKLLGLQEHYVTEKTNVSPKNEITWSDILSYLGIESGDLSETNLNYMKNAKSLKEVEQTAKFIKNSKKPENRIINRLSDPNIILNILMFSNKKLIGDIVDVFRNDGVIDGRCLGKAIESIPAIFMKNTPEEIPGNYDLFLKNLKILEENNVNVRNVIINKPVILLTSDLESLVNEIHSFGLDVPTMIEYCGNVFVVNKDLLKSNVEILKAHGVEVTNLSKGLGYEVLGYVELDKRLETIQKMSYYGEVPKNDPKYLDNIRAFFITNYGKTREAGRKRCV